MDIEMALLKHEPPLPPNSDVFESFKQFLEFSVFFLEYGLQEDKRATPPTTKKQKYDV